MDACLKENQNDAGDAAVRALVRVFIASVCPLLNGSSPENAQVILNTIALLKPKCDLRRLQALTFYRLGQYVEAMRCWNEIDDDMSARALSALCLRHIGEASWWGAAQLVYESGDAAAIEVLEPWMNETPEAMQLPNPSATAVSDAALSTASARAAAECRDYSFRPLRA